MAEQDVTLNVKVNTKQASKEIDSFSKDATQSLEGSAKKAESSFSSMFSSASSSVSNLAKGFGIASIAIAAVGFSLTAAFSQAQEIANTADEISKVNTQFDFLAEKAGDATGSLRESLVNVNQGINDTEDVLKAANVALTNLNLSTSDIGQNFEAARRISVAMGTDALQSFEAINTAIASGNTRVLRQVGLFVDADSAIESYASKIGIAAKYLSDVQKESALFEAIQAKVSDSFGNVDIQTVKVSESFKQFGEASKDVGEAVSVALTKIFGPSVQALLSRFTEELAGLATGILKTFGSETQKAAAAQEELLTNINKEREILAEYNKELEVSTGARKAYYETKISRKEQTLNALLQEKELIDEVKRKQESSLAFEKSVSTERAALTAEQIRKQEELATAKEVLIQKINALEAQNTTTELTRAQADEEFALLFNERKAQIEQESLFRIQQLKAEFAAVGLQNSQEFHRAEFAIQEKAALDIAAMQTARAEKLKQENKKRKQDELADQQAFFSAATSLSSAKTKELAAIGKAAAITEIAIKTPQAVASSFAFGTRIGGPILGFTLGAIAATAMAVQAAQVAGIPLATGLTEVPRGFPNDTFRASLTSGERVVNVAQNKDLTTFLENPSAGDQEGVINLLGSILDRLSNLENTVVVNIGNKEIMREVREGIRSGQQVFA